MIAYLRGRLASIDEESCVIDVAGVGYLVIAATRTLSSLPPRHHECELFIETVVREDSIQLFGFADPAERHWFKLLQGVQGVGSRVALAILSALDVNALATAISVQDRAAITRANGVGNRLASRIVTELKDRHAPFTATGSAAAMAAAATATAGPSVDGDVLSALTNLGYGRSEAALALQRAHEQLEGEGSFDTLIRQALQELAR